MIYVYAEAYNELAVNLVLARHTVVGTAAGQSSRSFFVSSHSDGVDFAN